jgi:hypothetical protein
MAIRALLTSLILSFFLFFQIARAQEDNRVEIIFGEDLTFSSVTNGFSYELILPEKPDLSSCLGISATVSNTGESNLRLECWINKNKWVNSAVYLEPGTAKTIQVLFQRSRESDAEYFPNMRGYPGGTFNFSAINPSVIERISFGVYTNGTATVSISDIRTYGKFIPPKELATSEGFFPLVDEMGQYRHANWPGKTRGINDMKESIAEEEKEISNFPGPSGVNKYGGWEVGPRLAATGHFRTENLNGKWWLVDPEGCLFWSHGITCVKHGIDVTPVSNRGFMFTDLPVPPDPLSRFYTFTDPEGRNFKDSLYNFALANLWRKYGENWREPATLNTLKRLKSWGINTFGNWSDPGIYLSPVNRVPYTLGISSSLFPDVFNPKFRESIVKSLSRLDSSIRMDPYCIGIFIDNEVKFDRLTQRLIAQAPQGYSRDYLNQYLKEKYGSLKNLNRSWKTSYNSWQEADTVTVFPEGAGPDLKDFDLLIIDHYYKVCMEETKSYAPQKLYLGSRMDFHYYPEDTTQRPIITIASKYCDVISFNRYRFSTRELILPEGIDKPTLIGEFHFGALDRGLCSGGLRTVASQEQRAESYYHYVEESLGNPQIVGTHWYMYQDMPFTGRSFSPSNYQVGFVDICDNPYPEIVTAARKIGYKLYRTRYGE